MTNVLTNTLRKAQKNHRCVWCGESISIGDQYVFISLTHDGAFQNQSWHPECRDDADQWPDDEFTLYSNDRPKAEAK